MGIAGNIANVLQRGGEAKEAAEPGDSFTEPTVTAQDATNAAKLTPLGYVASPTSAWTGVQSIRVSGFRFWWNGTAWTAGTPSGQMPLAVEDCESPTGMTVAVALAYATDHPECAASMLAAEQAGQNRITLVQALQSLCGG